MAKKKKKEKSPINCLNLNISSVKTSWAFPSILQLKLK